MDAPLLKGSSWANSWMYQDGQPEAERSAWEHPTWAAAGVLILVLAGLEVVALRRYRARRAGGAEPMAPTRDTGDGTRGGGSE